ncbi:IclR family transcriptional regulator [Streptomyces anulatus]|uniref:IclR family transcriptional regulator n=1 Tax=Streptomyces TaxID=1883 RepID=UPI0006DA0194|nr:MULTISPECIES: IclR family transcriptional regulator [Streptomyces]KPL30628.1 IclR family transcriptional regulator [Streptomyces anulatus]MBT1099782.1 IclR family transcriptional regulator [Streptomyces sp. Tu10]WSC59301.1 IclR family transcriptional regulator [Streptomyces anulatus]WTC61054.1 IclR family transcriptional regulator [Streptomyces anulatus]WTC75942.1 IclR family transcriptional regulator [Streptomyces anulatus]
MQSVLNALRVLEEVAARQPVGVADLARAMESPKSTVQRALLTLHTAGWIRPAGGTSTRWMVSTKALYVGRSATGELGLRDIAVPVMEELRRATDETVHLTVPEAGNIVLIERLETSKPVRIILPLGQNLPAHASANGKAVLAASSDEAVERHIADGLTRFTETSIVDPRLLRAALAEVRLRGYATNAGEWRSDVSAVAAAVLGDAGLPVASLSVNVPTSRMTEDSRAAFGAAVREAAKTVSEALRRTRGD